MTNLEKTFLDSLGGDVRRAWDQGHLVPCDECAGNGYVPVRFRENFSVETCPKCKGERWVE
jgi:DnaJ-class molecular chaperone